MPFVPHNAPEALLPRSDSRNPATTCKGITSNGRPCRRSLAASPRASPSGSPTPKRGSQGVLAVLPDIGDDHEAAAAFFCWQHKDQAKNLKLDASKANVLELKGRDSIDALADKLGVLEVEEHPNKGKSYRRGNKKLVAKESLPQAWQSVPGPLMTVPEDPLATPPAPIKGPKAQRKRTKGDIHFSFFCCMRPSDVDAGPQQKPRPLMNQVHSARPSSSKLPANLVSQSPLVPARSYPSSTPPNQHTKLQSSPGASSNQTQSLLYFIPSSLTPATTSALLSELAKPLTAADGDPGYIYIFCQASLTSVSQDPTASRNIASPSSSAHLQVPQRTLTGRRTSDAIRSFAQDSKDGIGASSSPHGGRRKSAPSGMQKRTMMLKIGRAANVSRRMTQWSQQCGHPIDLLRYYPYYSPKKHFPPSPSHSNSSRRASASSTTPTDPVVDGPRKVPFVSRVERLIHVELADKKVKRSCEGCGREHREWFEVEASRDGIKSVDEVVQRWVRWAEREGNTVA